MYQVRKRCLFTYENRSRARARYASVEIVAGRFFPVYMFRLFIYNMNCDNFQTIAN